ncbi:MAG: 8-oxo-dGTP diphosphatase [Lentisphaeraceae bacterium]|nr:8-oxo-dGTP diphosphatase [Lentisphaeraceae bacterium]
MKTIEASLVYLFKDDHVLMMHRVKKEKDIHKDKWNGLGGKLEPAESPEESAIREIKEESGYDIHNLKFAGHLFFPTFDKQQNDWSVFVFTSDDFTGLQLENTPEGNLEWIHKDELLNLNLWEGDRYFLPKLLSGDKFLGKFIYMDGRLVDYKLTDA